MRYSEDIIDQILKKEVRKIFVFAVSYEDRCIRLPELLSKLNPKRTKNRLICIELPDRNVHPLVSVKRKELKAKIQDLIEPEFSTIDRIKTILDTEICESVTKNQETNIIIDASGMPRGLILNILDHIGKSRNQFNRVFLTYSHPKEYLPGNLEIPSPIIKSLYSFSGVQRSSKVALAIFPGFNISETAVVISRVVDPDMEEQHVRLFWFLTHPGRHYAFYERSLSEHMVFFKFLEGFRSLEILCRMDDFNQIGVELIKLAKGIDDDEAFLVANLGPRIITVPILLTAHALHAKGRKVDVLIPQPLFYNSIRSRGFVGKLDVWNLEEEFSSIVNAL